MIYWRNFSFWFLSPISSCFSVSSVSRIKSLIVIFKNFINLGINTWVNHISLLMFSSLVDQILYFDIYILKLNFVKILQFWNHFTWTSLEISKSRQIWNFTFRHIVQQFLSFCNLWCFCFYWKSSFDSLIRNFSSCIIDFLLKSCRIKSLCVSIMIDLLKIWRDLAN